MRKFADHNTQVLGISTDSPFTLAAFAEKCGGLGYPLLSDFWPHGHVSLKYGVLREEGFPQRSVFIVDTQGNLNTIKFYELRQQPDNQELLAMVKKL
ncbi:MAG: redoxin domain-containing protein [candidate division NC10 bacterium]|nr:redoxin domain-containing protein [candidate division NC10 bacterium]